MEMQQRLIPEPSQTLISWLEDFLAKHSAWQDSDEDLTIQEEHSFLISQGFSITKDPEIFCLKTLKVYYLMTAEKTFQTMLGVLSDMGYVIEWEVLNSKNFGVPQNRERVFIVGHLGERSRRQIFPIRRNCTEVNV